MIPKLAILLPFGVLLLFYDFRNIQASSSTVQQIDENITIISTVDNNTTVIEENDTVTTTEYSDSASPDVSTIIVNGSDLSTSPPPTLSTNGTQNVSPSLSLRKSRLCPCNLTVNSCDINCCCDSECSETEKGAFSSCEEKENYEHDRWYCYSKPSVHKTNTNFVSKKTSSGIFCIVRDNVIKKQVYREPGLADSLSKFRKLLPRRPFYSWSGSFHNTQTTLPKNKMQVSDPILLVNSSDERKINIWRIQTQLFSTRCEASIPVEYLRNLQSTCMKQIFNFDTDCTGKRDLNAHSYYQDFYLVKFLSHSWSGNSTKHENASVVPFGNQVTCENWDSCVPVNCYKWKFASQNTEEYCEQNNSHPVPVPKLNADASVCENVVFKVEYKIIHNGSNGIVDASIALVLGSVSKTEPSFSFMATVDFRSSSDGNITYRKSGNPGYLVGKPVLGGHFTKPTKKDSETFRIVGNYLTVVGMGSNGLCSGEDRKKVIFGINHQTGCMLNFRFNLSNNCPELQNKILQLLLGNTPVNYVGIFGNADPNNSDDWVAVVNEGEPKLNLQSSDGDTCSSIVRGIDVQILFAKVDSVHQPQTKIVGVNIKYFPPVEISPKCIGSHCASSESDASIEVLTTVSFVDISKPAVTIYAPPPTINAKLPYDFFYPFLSSACRTKCHIFLIFVQIFLHVYNIFLN